MYRVIVSGWRHYTSDNFVRFTLMRLLKDKMPNVEIITGECKTGVDKFAKDWAIASGLKYKGFVANWGKYGKAAGPIRNEEMAVYLNQCFHYGDEIDCICFIHPKSKGTKDMSITARQYGIEPIEIKIS